MEYDLLKQPRDFSDGIWESKNGLNTSKLIPNQINRESSCDFCDGLLSTDAVTVPFIYFKKASVIINVIWTCASILYHWHVNTLTTVVIHGMSPEGSRTGKRRYSQTFPAILQVMHERHYLRHQKTKQSVHINEILAVRYVQTPPFDLLHLLKVNTVIVYLTQLHSVYVLILYLYWTVKQLQMPEAHRLVIEVMTEARGCNDHLAIFGGCFTWWQRCPQNLNAMCSHMAVATWVNQRNTLIHTLLIIINS